MENKVVVFASGEGTTFLKLYQTLDRGIKNCIDIYYGA